MQITWKFLTQMQTIRDRVNAAPHFNSSSGFSKARVRMRNYANLPHMGNRTRKMVLSQSRPGIRLLRCHANKKQQDENSMYDALLHC